MKISLKGGTVEKRTRLPREGWVKVTPETPLAKGWLVRKRQAFKVEAKLAKGRIRLFGPIGGGYWQGEWQSPAVFVTAFRNLVRFEYVAHPPAPKKAPKKLDIGGKKG